MSTRQAYVLDLTQYGVENLAVASTHRAAKHIDLRHPSPADRAALAVLMLDAYRGTVDYNDDSDAEVQAQVRAYFDGRDARPLLECSWVCLVESALVAACLVGWDEKSQVPLIVDLMTRGQWKRHGLGTTVLLEALQSLIDEGYKAVRAAILEGDMPSETVFSRAGFVKLHDTA